MRRGLNSDLALATSAHVSQKLLGYVVLAILARSLDRSEMGELFFAITFASIFVLLTELGTSRYLVREIAQDQERALEHVSEVFSLRLPALAASFLLLSLIALVFMPDRVAILLLAGVFVFIGDLYSTFGALFLGLRRLGYRFVTGLIGPGLLVLFVLVAVRLGWKLHAILGCYVVANVTLVVVTALLVRMRLGRFGLVVDVKRMGRVMARSFPFFALVFLSLLFLKIDTLMLRFMRSAAEVADYEAGYKFFEVSRFVVRPVAMVFLPLCTQLVARRDAATFGRTSRRLMGIAGGGGAAMALGVIAAAAPLVPAVWGPAYASSVPVLRILFLGVPFLYLSFVGTVLAQALGLERTLVRLMAGCVIGNVLMNGVAITFWGAQGAAWTTVISESILAGWLISLVWHGTRGLRAEEAAGRSRGTKQAGDVVDLDVSPGIAEHDTKS